MINNLLGLGYKQFKGEERNLFSDMMNRVAEEADQDVKKLIVNGKNSIEKTVPTWLKWLTKPFSIILVQGTVLFDTIWALVGVAAFVVSSQTGMGSASFGVMRKYSNKIRTTNTSSTREDDQSSYSYVSDLLSGHSDGTNQKNSKEENNQPYPGFSYKI